MKLHVKKGDMVMVVSGSAAHIRDKEGNKSAKVGKVLEASPKNGTLVVDGVNKRIHHEKPRKQGQAGGRMEKEVAIHASNVMLYCEKCKKPTRIAVKVTGEGASKKKVRVCKHCGADLG